ncbi:MAG: AAA family ATPase [Microbacteriaceae bacterium]|nr:AAA family ATPase [Microbacteriaceae bacterium]
MWGLENTATAEKLPVINPGDGPDGSPGGLSAPALGEAGLQLLDVAEPVRARWRDELAHLGGPSPLLHFEDTPRTRIELTSTHPGGLARFIAGKRTRLSSLIRENFAWRTAQLAADSILAKATELAAARGLDALRLGVVVANWEHTWDLNGEPFTERFSAPVLLRPVTMRRVGDDFELALRGRNELNPAFAAALHAQFGIRLDHAAFPALAQAEGGGFTPNVVIDRLRGLTAHLPGFQVAPRLVLTSFAEVAGAMVADARTLAHPVLDAIAGNEAAVQTVRESFRLVEPVPSDARSPQTDSLLLDADDEQERVLAQIAAGNSLVVRTLPGSGATQTIVNAIGALAADGKRVLVVGARRASLRAIRERLESIGLPGLVASPRTARRDAVQAITRAERAKQGEQAEIDDALVRLRSVIRDYREALTRPDPILGVTVLDCISELSRLAGAAPRARTTARLGRAAVEALASPAERDRFTQVMVAAERYGEFQQAPGESAWFGAQFVSADAATRAHGLAQRLHAHALPELVDRGERLIAGTHMRPFQSVVELGTYCRLLLDLRETLDRFQPAVFDRAITELIAATAPRRDHPEMTNADRRRLKKLAEEYLRPGVHVPDLHEALVKVQRQRVLWHRYVAEGAVPRVPVGIAEVLVALQAVELDLAELDGALGRSGDERLAAMPIAELRRLLAGLAGEAGALSNLQERSALMGALHAVGLDPLVQDLAGRRVPAEAMRDETELAWWKSALAGLLEGDRALLGANTSVLDRLEADFRLVDEAHARGNAGALAWHLAEQWKLGLVDWPEEAARLKAVLRREHATSHELHTAAPHLDRALTPVWIASPYEMPQISPVMPFDAVLLVDAGTMTIAEAALAVRRGRQVVAFGDPVTQTPSAFETMVRERRAGEAVAEAADLHEESALAVLSGLLRVFTLTRSYRAGGEDLVELVNRRFYSGRIQAQPWAGTYRGVQTLAVERIADARGALDQASGAVESPDAEVARVVELVLDHARTHFAESLMVVTPSRRHAARVLSAVLEAFGEHRELVPWLTEDRDEPFEVLALDQAVAASRDRVIFSLGHGRTAHGRVLTDFGPLSAPGGDRCLASALTSARRALTIVTAIGPEDLADRPLGPGTQAFAAVLEDAEAHRVVDDRDGDGDPMVVDLAARLRARGLVTRLGYRGALPLVVSYGTRCAVVESDADLLAGSLRESLRLRPELLKRFGWAYVRVHAFELFQDPDLVADRITELLGAEVPAIRPVVSSPVAAPAPGLEDTDPELTVRVDRSAGRAGDADAPVEALVSERIEASPGPRRSLAPQLVDVPTTAEAAAAAPAGAAPVPFMPAPTGRPLFLDGTAVGPDADTGVLTEAVVAGGIRPPAEPQPIPATDHSAGGADFDQVASAAITEPLPVVDAQPLEDTESGFEPGHRPSGWSLRGDADEA